LDFQFLFTFLDNLFSSVIHNLSLLWYFA